MFEIAKTIIPPVTKQDELFDKLETRDELEEWITLFRYFKTSHRNDFYIDQILCMTQNIWLTPDQLYNEYGISKSTQSKYRMSSSKSGLPFHKLGGKFIRYKRAEINQWIESHKMR